MCFHVKSPTPKQVKQAFPTAQFLNNQWHIGKLNGFDRPLLPCLTWDKESNQLFVEPMQWGLTPHWAKDDQIALKTLNARIESIHETASFKDYVTNRMVFITDGFYEWKWHDAKGKEKEPFYIQSGKEPLTLMGGIYNENAPFQSSDILKTCSMVTTVANEVMAEIHNIKKRMPVLLNENSVWEWLKEEDIDEFLHPEIILSTESLQPPTPRLF